MIRASREVFVVGLPTTIRHAALARNVHAALVWVPLVLLVLFVLSCLPFVHRLRHGFLALYPLVSKLASQLVLWVTGLFLAIFLVWPVLESVTGAFLDPAGRVSLSYLTEVFQNRIYLEGLWNALLMGLGSTAIALAVALPLAWVGDRYEFPLKRALTALALAPMVLPPFVGAIGMMAIFGQMGAVNALLHAIGLLPGGQTIDWLGRGRFAGIVILNGLHLYPILYLNAAAALANVDPALEEAAENLGCTGWRKFRRVTLPLMMPGIFAGGSIVFIWAFTELGAPLMFNFTRILPVQIFNGMKELNGNGMPFALVVVMLIAAMGLYWLTRFLLGRAPVAAAGRATLGRAAKRAAGFKGGLCAALFAAVAAVALLPHAAVVILSFAKDWYGTILPASWTLGHYREALGHSLTIPSIGNSVRYSGLATLVDLVLGIGIAWVITRQRASMRAGAALLDGLTMLPLAVPGLVLAFGYIALSQPGRALAGLNPGLHSATLLLVVAYAIRRLPYMVRSVVAGLEQTSVTFEEAAQSLGASPARTLKRITLPLISGNILAGMLMAFAFAMLEVSDSLILAQRSTDYPSQKPYTNSSSCSARAASSHAPWASGPCYSSPSPSPWPRASWARAWAPSSACDAFFWSISSLLSPKSSQEPGGTSSPDRRI